jgi:GTP-binding protein
MLDVVAILGRPNVGKSTLFNALSKTNDALVLDLPGTTRDRQYGVCRVGERPFIIIDTGGIGLENHLVDNETTRQSWRAVAEADIILLIVDAQEGLHTLDIMLSNELRKIDKPKFLVVNKTDKTNLDVALADFYRLGISEPIPISASNNKGLLKMVTQLPLKPQPEVTEEEKIRAIEVAIVGQPNVGKSTLINRILGEDRVVVSDLAGTTRDSIEIPFTRNDKEYVLIDTAGVKRKAKTNLVIDKYSIIKSLQAIETCNVVVFMVDATRGVLAQDLSLLDFILEQGKALVILVNKWDIATHEQRNEIKDRIQQKLQFIEFAKIHYVSALHGHGVQDLFKSVDKAYASAMIELSTSRLTGLLAEFVSKHQPPLAGGRRVKLRYAHSGGKNPPRIIIHGNQTDHVIDSYKKYLTKCFIAGLNLEGTPVKIHFKTSENPYQGIKNVLTEKQQRQRNRVKKLFKKK